MRELAGLTAKYAISRLPGMNKAKQFFGRTFRRNLHRAQINLAFFYQLNCVIWQIISRINRSKKMFESSRVDFFLSRYLYSAAFMYSELYENILHNRRVNFMKYYIIMHANQIHFIICCKWSLYYCGLQRAISSLTRLSAAGMIAATSSTSLVTR